MTAGGRVNASNEPSPKPPSRLRKNIAVFSILSGIPGVYADKRSSGLSDCSADERDIELAVGGDRDAVARLLILQSGRLANRISSRLRLNAYADFSADDVLQEVYLDVFRGIRVFEGHHLAQFTAWLNRITDSRLATMLRERGRKKRGGAFRRVVGVDSQQNCVDLVNQLSDHDITTASQHVSMAEVTSAVQVSLATLPDEQREAIRLRYLEQHSLESTASAMCKSNDAVRGLLYRAKQSMRDVLGRSTRWFNSRS